MDLETRSPQPYCHRIWDSARWSGISQRSGDIVITTGYRAGTTWMQRICSLLIFQQTELAHPLHHFSPWVELKAETAEEVWRRYMSQTHRRFMKTHTPFDGLPYSPEVDYVFVGRDPRDVVISLWHQLRNVPAGDQTIKLPATFSGFLESWLSVGCMPGETDGWPYWSYFDHAKSFWAARQLQNLHFFHYYELLGDLPGQMRRLAGLLEFEIEDELWPRLIEAASFARMKSNSKLMTPLASEWKDSAAFFNRGQAGQWQDVFEAPDLQRYWAAVDTKLSPELSGWLHRGSRGD